MTSPKTTAAVSTDAMRAEADQLKASVREDNRSLYERHRRAVQLEYEAGLIDDRDLCLAELTGARGYLAKLQDAVAPAVAAERKAQDRLRADQGHLARRQAEQDRLRDGYAPAERQEDAAIRVHAAEGVAARGLQEVAKATAAREAAEAALRAWEAHVAGLEREHGATDRKAKNPGTAPNMPALARWCRPPGRHRPGRAENARAVRGHACRPAGPRHPAAGAAAGPRHDQGQLRAARPF